MKLNTKPLKFKCELADGGGGWGVGGGGWLADPCKAWVPPPSIQSRDQRTDSGLDR